MNLFSEYLSICMQILSKAQLTDFVFKINKATKESLQKIQKT